MSARVSCPRGRRLGLAIAAAAAASAMYAPGGASAAVTVGADTSTGPGVLTGCAGDDCTIVGTGDPKGFSYVIPFDGVVVRWRIWTELGAAPWRLRTAREIGSLTYVATGKTEFEAVSPGAERTFEARLPVAQGDRLAIDGPPSSTAAIGTTAGGGFRTFIPPLTEGEPPRSSSGSGGGFMPLISADVEADADGDGHGDETQDLCPTNPAKQVECVAPQTTITKAKRKVKTKRKKARVTVRFAADEPATFECAIDRRPFRSCASPLKTKLKRGKHKIAVRAIDLAGNLDPDPVVAKVKIKRRR